MRKRKLLYLLGDGIYPLWKIVLLPMANYNEALEMKYSFGQESIRKDMVHLFGTLQSRFEIIRRESRP